MAACNHCHGTGQPNGIKGGPEHGVCGYCMGSGATSTRHAVFDIASDKFATLRAENEALRRERDDDVQTAVVRLGIDVEKLLCGILGREWSAAGISIVSLCDEISRRIKDAVRRVTTAESTVEALVKALEEIADPAMGSHGCATDEELHAYWRDEAIRHRAVASAALSNHRSQK